MKYVIIHGDGMADWPCAELGGKTPLEAARKPNMDLLATRGTLGMVATIPTGMPSGSDVGTMTMLGYDPKRYHTGRAPIEAASMGIEMGPRDVVFRMNLVSLTPGDGGALIMNDFTSGHITSEEAARIVDDIRVELGGDGIEFFNGVSYRHLMMRSAEILREHPVNKARRANGKTETTSAWFWGQGTRPAVPTLKDRFGVEGSVISAVDLVNGLGRLAGLQLIKVPGATGFLDTDYAAKARYGLEALKSRDFLLLHIEAPDEAGHMGRADLKTEAIERIDELIIGPLVSELEARGDFTILLMPDHATPSQLKTHSPEPVPFALLTSTAIKAGPARRYTEAEGNKTGIVVSDGYRLIDSLFGRALSSSN